MAEQTLGDRDERLAANFNGTEFTECFPTSEGKSFRSKLGTAASRNVTTSATDTTAGRLLKVGDGGLLSNSLYVPSDIDDMTASPGATTFFGGARLDTANIPVIQSGSGIHLRRATSGGETQLYFVDQPARNDNLWYRVRTTGSWSDWRQLYHTGNTTVDSNGFIKEASPIIRLFGNGEIEEPCQPTNATVTRKSKGHYEITGTLGFAQKGWYIETPKDANGSIKVLTEYSQDKKGKITVKTYEPTGKGWRPEKGDPVDIPNGRWIDIRLEAPEPEETDVE